MNLSKSERPDVTDMREANVGDATWVYPLPREWHGEYGWTTDTAAEFECIDDPVEVVRQRWLLVRAETVVFHPRTELCETCAGEGVITVPIPDPMGLGADDIDEIDCPGCEGDGQHPLAGQMEVLP